MNVLNKQQTNKQKEEKREARVNEKQQHKERQPAHCLEGTVIMMFCSIIYLGMIYHR